MLMIIFALYMDYVSRYSEKRFIDLVILKIS